MAIDRALLAAWVAASCAEQGVPVRVADPATVDRVVVLLTGAAGRASARQRGSSQARPATAARTD